MCYRNIEVIFFIFGKALSIVVETYSASQEFRANIVCVFDGFFMTSDDKWIEAIKKCNQVRTLINALNIEIIVNLGGFEELFLCKIVVSI